SVWWSPLASNVRGRVSFLGPRYKRLGHSRVSGGGCAQEVKPAPTYHRDSRRIIGRDMRENRLKRMWEAGRSAVGGWLTVPSSFSAELMAQAGFDWLCVDMQHGVIDYQVAVTMLQAISTTETVPIVRVLWNEPGMIMKALDAGAYGVVVPIVNTAAEAEVAVSACRYPPRGIRSHGPIRAALYGGRDYLARADEEVLCIVQVETKESVENLTKFSPYRASTPRTSGRRTSACRWDCHRRPTTMSLC